MELPTSAIMACPHCAQRIKPLEGSTWVVAWYSCTQCGHYWSARLRDGRPAAGEGESTGSTGTPGF